MSDKYSEDEERLIEMKEKHQKKINELKKQIQEARDNLIMVEGKLQYINYRREKESE